MFDLESSISDWRKQMLASGITAPAPLDELEIHLRDEIQGLVKAGVPGEKAFAVASNGLGEARSLRAEFSKVNRHRLWVYRDNPLSLKILAASFILTGLDPLLTSARFEIRSIFQYHGIHFLNLTLVAVVLFWGFQIPLGLGLLRRSNAWRRVTLAWSGFIILTIALSSLWAAFHSQSPLVHNGVPQKTDFLWGIEVPFQLRFSLYLLYQAITAAGLYILNKPSICDLFKPSAKPKTRVTAE